MTVVEVVDDADQPAGFVVDEARRGYTWKGRLLRYAEVRASRSTPS
jgi:molecular chaperone GrpE